MDPSVTDFIAREARFGARNYEPLGVVLSRGEGVFVWDTQGHRYLDCLSAYSAVNQGHSEGAHNSPKTPLRMAVALIYRGIGGEAIEVAMALRIPNKDALAARQNDAERFVVLGAKARFPRDEISDRWIHVSSFQLERTGRQWAIAIFQPANAR